ncbi:glycosyltransferase family 4 protein [Enterococcus sp. HY326]|uniref:glycosyltransferase family 4 protein n=1 Tax=Enterococcus sp. HY326 TaxID=2971265 RepID=UPI00223EB2CD|nr:glycosyltransferase family 4 protein [Enterococcus sp. HY326]
MRKILFISPSGTMDNGAEISNFNLMKYLVASGHQVFNVAPQARHESQIVYYDRSREAGIETNFIPILKWWWEEAPSGYPGTLEERAMFHRENIKVIQEYIEKNQIDLVITNTVNMFQGAVAAAITGVPHFWMIHEFPEGEFGYYKEKIDFISAYSNELYSVSGELNQRLNELFNPRLVKEFSPYTEIHAQELKAGKKRRIVSVGRLTKRKNQLELIKAFEQLSRNDLELVLIGAWDDDYIKLCKNYIKEHQVKGVTFKGNLENPWSEVTDQDICVFPSAMETFGLVYVEALLNGVPVVLSDNPGHLSAYNIFNFGKLYQSGDVHDLTEKIVELLENFSTAKEAATAFKPTAKDYYQIATVYKELLQDIDSYETSSISPLRHLEYVLATNEKKSRLARLELKIRRFKNKVVNRINRYFGRV